MKKSDLALTLVISVMLSATTGCMSTQPAASSGAAQSPSAPASQTSSAPAVAATGKTVIKISHGLTDTHPAQLGALEFKKEIEAKYPDKFEVQVYPNAQLGDDVKATQDLTMGNLEMEIPSASPLIGMDPALSVFDLPFIVPDAKAADAIYDGAVGKQIAAGLDSHGAHLLAYFENGFRQITNSRHEIKTPSDLKGLKIRTMENQIHLAAFKAMGASPTPMAFSEVFSAMQQKTIDGQENPISTIYLSKYYEVQKYCTITNHLYGPHLFLISESLWNKLTPDEQTFFTQAAQSAAKVDRDANRKMCDDDVALLQQNGMKVTTLTDSERQAFIDACKPVYDQFRDQIGADLIKQFQDVCDQNK